MVAAGGWHCGESARVYCVVDDEEVTPCRRVSESITVFSFSENVACKHNPTMICFAQ
jgi:hypothetical protein